MPFALGMDYRVLPSPFLNCNYADNRLSYLGFKAVSMSIGIFIIKAKVLHFLFQNPIYSATKKAYTKTVPSNSFLQSRLDKVLKRGRYNFLFLD